MRRKIVPIIVTAHAAVAIPVLSVAAASADDQTANPQAGASIVGLSSNMAALPRYQSWAMSIMDYAQ